MTVHPMTEQLQWDRVMHSIVATSTILNASEALYIHYSFSRRVHRHGILDLPERVEQDHGVLRHAEGGREDGRGAKEGWDGRGGGEREARGEVLHYYYYYYYYYY